jgi:hypothetical protein
MLFPGLIYPKILQQAVPQLRDLKYVEDIGQPHLEVTYVYEDEITHQVMLKIYDFFQGCFSESKAISWLAFLFLRS